MIEIITQLKTERQKLKLSQIALAELVGIDYKAISLWERGQRRMYTDTFIAWANALGYELSLVKIP